MIDHVVANPAAWGLLVLGVALALCRAMLAEARAYDRHTAELRDIVEQGRVWTEMFKGIEPPRAP